MGTLICRRNLVRNLDFSHFVSAQKASVEVSDMGSGDSPGSVLF